VKRKAKKKNILYKIEGLDLEERRAEENACLKSGNFHSASFAGKGKKTKEKKCERRGTLQLPPNRARLAEECNAGVYLR